MNLIKRIAWYSGGFVIGLMILFFILGGKKTSCDYGPNSRVLKNIRSKEIRITPETLANLNTINMDTTIVNEMLISGKVVFSESNTDLDSCKIYVIRKKIEKRKFKMYVENCNKKAHVKAIVAE